MPRGVTMCDWPGHSDRVYYEDGIERRRRDEPRRDYNHHDYRDGLYRRPGDMVGGGLLPNDEDIIPPDFDDCW